MLCYVCFKMGYSDFIDQLAKAGLTVRAFAELMRMNPNSVSNYARSREVPSHLAVIAALIAEMNVRGLDFRRAILSIERSAKKPRGRAQRGQFGGDRQVPLDLSR
jgi:hypothetical protein